MDVPLVFMTILILISAAHAQDPEIVDEIWPEVKQVGRTGRLNCTVVNKQQNFVVEWTFFNSKELISQDEAIHLSINPVMAGKRKYEVQRREENGRVTYMLIIRRLREQNAGIYECRVRTTTTDFTKWPKKTGRLTVQVAPTIRPGGTTAVLTVEQNADANLTCSATGIPPPNITWTRSDGYSLPTGFAQFRGAVLPLHNATIEMGGVYRCVADNNIRPPAYHLAQVRVSQRPSVRAVQDTVGQFPNNRLTAKLECITQGYPSPTVTWKKVENGARVTVDDADRYFVDKLVTDNQNLKAYEEWYTLTILNVEARDFTDYYCVATNVKGSAEQVFTLFETSECQGPNCQSLPSTAVIVKISISAIFVMAVPLLF